MNLSCGQILKFSLLLKNAAKGSNCHVEPGFTTQSSPTLSHVCGQNSWYLQRSPFQVSSQAFIQLETLPAMNFSGGFPNDPQNIILETYSLE